MNKKNKDENSQNIDRYRIMFEHAPVCIHEIDAEGRLLSMNRAGLDMMGVDNEDQVRGRFYLDFISPAERKRIKHLMGAALKGETVEFEFQAAGAASLRYFSSCFIPCPNGEGEITRLIGISSDITASKESEAELQRLNRTYMVLSRCNSDLARSVDEDDLLNAFCRNLVEIGGYLYAWVGYAQQDSARSVRMMAHAGTMGDDFSLTAITWADDEQRYSACGQSIRSGRPVIFHDIEKESGFAPWRAAALRQGARSVIALPLKTDGQAFGNFSIFSTKADAFSKKEVALLMDLAEDLAFGIKTARARLARKQTVRRLREEVEQEERRRIAATLHDGVAQSVQAVNLVLKRVRDLGDKKRQQRCNLLNRAICEIGGVSAELREISHELRPLFLERMELQEAIRYHCNEQSRGTGLVIHVSGYEKFLPMEERVKQQCFLSFREALNNAIKHASASRIEVTLEIMASEALVIQIDDDGVGFDSEEVFSLPSGLGLAMMAERAHSVGGHTRIHSTPGQGTAVTITVPLVPNQMHPRKLEADFNLCHFS
jgi:PAS domain S-box-containing protein